jgi:nucleoside-diphosphate-sugar epimerase
MQLRIRRTTRVDQTKIIPTPAAMSRTDTEDHERSPDQLPDFYGPLKAASERAATARFSDVSIVRPAYVCGPYDPTDCFTYWVRRMADGGDVVRLDASARMHIIDVRDLGAFLLQILQPVIVSSQFGALRRISGASPREAPSSSPPEGQPAMVSS